MHHDTQALIQKLRLAAHPEGGWYREVFRSSDSVVPADARGPRSALTSIYFLLEAGQRSRWHVVTSGEVWVHLQGGPLDLWTWDAPRGEPVRTQLGSLAAGLTPQHVVPAGHWQAAEPANNTAASYALVACVVAPGFDFADFSFMQPGSTPASALRAAHPALERFI
jgi:uncharacterized protein